VRSCQMITVPSEWVANDIVEAFEIQRSKVAVVPFGSTNLFPKDHCNAADVRAKYRLDRPFFFYPSRTYPHKNHRFLLEAFRPVADQADLVLTGPSWFRDRSVSDAARQLGLSGKVRHLGMVSRAELAGLYQAAAALVYPTRFEGFGAPVLEAMSMHCPVIASNVTAIPEVAGDAAVLLDPGDLEGWTEMMEKLLSDEDLRQLLIGKGDARAGDFSWERSARLQLDAYRIAAGQ
ncbi:MAG: glycosyltransferase family 1 protein, partial [Actinomycetota bacterium]